MKLSHRKELELKIISNLESPNQLEAVLAECWASGLFTKEEMEIIVSGTKVYEVSAKKNTEKIERFTNMSKKIGATNSFVILNFIKQLPDSIVEDGYFLPNKKSIYANCKINDRQYIAILLNLVDKKLIETKIMNKKQLISLNWNKIQEVSEI